MKSDPEAMIFDLDGVITFTAQVHAAAWKQLFDEFLKERSAALHEPYREFTIEGDYLTYVDGKPRYEGVASFLSSRNISIPYGSPSDSPTSQTVCGLGDVYKRQGLAWPLGGARGLCNEGGDQECWISCNARVFGELRYLR